MIPKEYEKYENTVTVAAVNWKGEWGNKEANLKKIKAKRTQRPKEKPVGRVRERRDKSRAPATRRFGWSHSARPDGKRTRKTSKNTM